MDETAFDATSLFDEDYLRFYADRIADARSEADVALIWQLLDLEPGMRVLDLACGHGRIANRLAARGCDVTGLDVTPMFLDVARREAAAQHLTVDYVAGDMRSLPWTQRFDRVVNWFTAYGYFDDDGNHRVLDEAFRVLRPGGRIALDLNSRDSVIRDFQPAIVTERDDGIMIDRSRLEPLTGRLVTERLVMRGGLIRRIPFFVRLFTFTELRDWLLAAGFTQVDGYGNDGSALSASSRRMIVVAQR